MTQTLDDESAVQADSGIRARPASSPGSDQKFDVAAFVKGDLPKKLLIMLVSSLGHCAYMPASNACQSEPYSLDVVTIMQCYTAWTYLPSCDVTQQLLWHATH